MRSLGAMKPLSAIAAAAVLLAAGAAWALKPGDTVYVRARNTPLQSKPSTTSKPAAPALQPGAKLQWLEQAKDAPRFHKVRTAKGATGYVWYQNLSTTPPRTELVVESGKAKNVDAQAFASYGAAARGVASGPRKVSGRLDKETTAKQFAVLEEVARQVKKTDAAPKAHVAAGGTP